MSSGFRTAHRSFLLTITACLTLPVLAHTDNQTCAEKRQAIENQINYATTHHNTAELNRLQIAQSKVMANCNDDDLKQKHHDKVAKYQHQLSEDQKRLAEAKASGNPEKIAKAQKRIEKTTKKLADLQTNHH